MEITTICVCIVVWLVLVVASILSAAFFSLIDDNNETGYMITLLWCTLGLAISITHILVMKGVI